MTWQDIPPSPGSPVRTRVSFYWHYGIFVSPEEVIQFGLPDDPTCPGLDIRVLKTDVYTFLSGGNLETGVPDRREKRKMRKPEQVIACARASLGEGGYDLRNNNCEDFMLRCLFPTP